MNDKQPLVTIRCITYNHESYIRQCLEGFVMQKTNFPFEAIVHDDASTDGTAAIIREYAAKYPDIIKPIYEVENQYSKHDGSLSRIMNFHTRGKYIAMCEGDDYWIDPLKLQKQVDFLESHPEYGLVCTDVNFYFQSKNKFQNAYFKHKNYPIKYTFEDFLIRGWFIAPCTWLFRAGFIGIEHPNFIVGDLPLLLEISSRSKVSFFDEVTAVYRILNKSASHLNSFELAQKMNKGISEIQYYYMKYTGSEYARYKIAVRNNILMMKVSLRYKKFLSVLYYAFQLLKMCVRIN